MTKPKTRLPRCFRGGGHPRAVADEEQRAEERIAELAAKVVTLGEDTARKVAEVRQSSDDLARAWEELERLFPEIFMYRSGWQRIRDAIRRPNARVAPTNRGDDGVVTVEMMSPFLREFLSMDD